ADARVRDRAALAERAIGRFDHQLLAAPALHRASMSDVLFSRGDRTYQLELTRDGNAIVEQVHVGNQPARRDEHPTLPAALAAYRLRIGQLIGEGWTVAQALDDVAWPIA